MDSEEQPFERRGPPSSSQVVAGSRNSKLALIQARHIISQISQSLSYNNPPNFSISTGNVAGDADKSAPFLALSKQMGGSDAGKSLWTNGLEMELASGKTDFIIHCLKDMPTTLPERFVLGAVAEREDSSDAVIMRVDSKFKTMDELPPGSVVGTSSSRRKALVKRNWPHLKVEECRGNLDTRLAKLDALDSPFSCILLATAGMVRFGLGYRITQRLDPKVFPYAVGQGALAIEVMRGRKDVLQLVRAVDHPESRLRGLAERAMLRSLQGGCSSPIGVWSSLQDSTGTDAEESSLGGRILHLHGTVLNTEGTRSISAEYSAVVRGDDEAEQVGVTVAKLLLERGANTLLSRPS